jgi:hypothetical protein
VSVRSVRSRSLNPAQTGHGDISALAIVLPAYFRQGAGAVIAERPAIAASSSRALPKALKSMMTELMRERA